MPASDMAPPQVPNVATDYPHNYSGKTQQVTFVKFFTFTHADQTQERFPIGTYEVPVEVASHWFAQAHTDRPPERAPAPGTPAYAQARREETQALTEKQNLQTTQAMTAVADINRRAIEQQVRLETTDAIRAELTAKIRAETEASVRAELTAKIRNEVEAEMTKPPATDDQSADPGAKTTKTLSLPDKSGNGGNGNGTDKGK